MPETIHFSKDLYGVEGVRDAVEAYAALATITLEEAGQDIVVTISDPDPDVDNLVDEFCNHALYETVARRGDGSPV